jgi:serine/threonine-protein kinase
LAQVIERACDPVPTERYDSVEAFRGALVSYLDHRGSLTVMRAAEERLSVLKQAVSAGQLDGVGTQETAAGLDQLFSACRFGFEQALEAWPENQGAQDGLQCCLETMIRHELSARLHRSAAALIRDLPRARPDLAAECDQLRQEVLVQEKAQEQLRTLRREAQLHGENWRRSRVLAVNGVLWCLGLGAVAVGVRSGMSVPAPHQNLVFGLFWLAAAGGMRYVLRRQLAENVRFGQFMAASTFLPLAAVVNRLLTLVTARSFYETLVTDYVIVFVCLGIGAATMERALWLPTAVVGTGAFLAGVHPELSLEIAAVLALFVNVHIAWLLRPRGGRVTATLNPEGSN